MYRYIIRRLIQAVPTIFGVSILSFLIMTAAPGGPTAAMALDPNIRLEDRQFMEELLGLNDPWHMQYLYWLIGDDWFDREIDGETYTGDRQGILRGDFGFSFGTNREVVDLIGELIIPTLELTGSAFIVGLMFGLPIGILAAINRGGIFDNVTRVAAVIFNAIPNFYLGLILILVFAFGMDILPPYGRCPPPTQEQIFSGETGCVPIYQRLEYLILPTFTLGTVYIAGYSRYMRASMLDVIGQDYIRTARSKGLSNRMVWFKHGARNAMIPIATFLGPAILGLIGGSVVVEQVFNWPGLGKRTIVAVTQFDYAFIMAVVMLGAVATILGYILSDILYALIDPRIRFT